MRKLISVSAIMAVLTLPAYAIAPAPTVQPGVGGSTTCDNTTLGQSENNSTANVEADWTANTIRINWWVDDSAQTIMATNTCTYDGTITLPTQPTKTGYTFAGWQLRSACETITNETECTQLTHCTWSVDLEGQGECASRPSGLLE